MAAQVCWSAHHHAGQVSRGEPGTPQVRAGERRFAQVIGLGERGQARIMPEGSDNN
jgi:hypothetical protein